MGVRPCVLVCVPIQGLLCVDYKIFPALGYEVLGQQFFHVILLVFMRL